METIEVQDKLIKNLEKDVSRLEAKVKEWEDWKATSKERHAKGKAKTESQEYFAITTKSGNTRRDRAITKDRKRPCKK